MRTIFGLEQAAVENHTADCKIQYVDHYFDTKAYKLEEGGKKLNGLLLEELI